MPNIDAIPVQDGPVKPWLDRLLAVLVLALAAAFVYALSLVSPDPRGHGTHEQLGMAPCSWPEQFHIPCPTCGVTTAAAHLVHLSPLRSLGTQPFGFALTLAGLWLAAVALSSLVRGRSLTARLALLPFGTLLGLGALLLLASWLYTYLTWDL